MQRTLKAVPVGEAVLVVGIDAGRKARARLESMGIIPGIELSILNNSVGPMLVSFGEGRVIVERGVAEKVIVA